MKYLALLAMMAMIHISSSEIRCWNDNSWRLAFDRAGWAHCGERRYLRGFYRQENSVRRHHISLIEYARCCRAPTPNEKQNQNCTSAKWTTVLDR